MREIRVYWVTGQPGAGHIQMRVCLTKKSVSLWLAFWPHPKDTDLPLVSCPYLLSLHLLWSRNRGLLVKGNVFRSPEKTTSHSRLPYLINYLKLPEVWVHPFTLKKKQTRRHSAFAKFWWLYLDGKPSLKVFSKGLWCYLIISPSYQ